MAALDDLVDRIEDPGLRDSIKREIKNIVKQKRFGLVFESHLPECTPLYGVPIKKGSLVAKRDIKIEDIFEVLEIKENIAFCRKKAAKDMIEKFKLDEIVSIAEFGEPIYPSLEPIDDICNAPDSNLWHTIIEADNYHALQLLQYMYIGKVDCIYIDPPYNSGAKDWKYNNDFVDDSDSYRHSKWLSMIERRLKLAKKLLNPTESTLIVTIDEKECSHLGCLLEQLFPESKIQMITSVINPKGNRRDGQFSRCEEYLFFVYIGNSSITTNGCDMLRNEKSEISENETDSIRLRALLRGASNHGRRSDRPGLFYPILFDKETGKFVGHGPILDVNEDRTQYVPPEGTVAMWPIAVNGEELTWNLKPETLIKKHENHFLSFGEWKNQKRVGYYLSSGQEEDFYNGLYEILGIDDDGAYILKLKNSDVKKTRPMSVWNQKKHSASEYGTTLLNSIIGSGKFNFPKSVYAVKDTLAFILQNKPNALVIDFFAGSGTTLHAINLLNAEDGGSRRCICITNNEVSAEETTRLKKKGLKPGDIEWEKLGIARYVTWPRTICTIKGEDIEGNPLKGEYIGTDFSMSDGFRANVAFFKLSFLDRNLVSLGHKFKELIPILWMKSNCKGRCPTINEGNNPEMLILPENGFAILINEIKSKTFAELVSKEPGIEYVYIVTDSETGYRSIVSKLSNRLQTYQLYRDYLDNFSIIIRD